MKAAVVQGYGQPLKIEEVPVRVPGRYEVLVKVIACGVCHTDLHAVDGDWPAKPKMPLIPGHEGVGIVVACGPEAFVKEGDTIVEGQVLCIVEAMKLMNEVKSDKSGKIAKILVKNGEPVKKGDKLFLID